MDEATNLKKKKKKKDFCDLGGFETHLLVT